MAGPGTHPEELREQAAAYRWTLTAAPRVELRRLGRAQVDRAIAELDLQDRDAAVHQVRKRCKKLRALLRLVRPVAGDLYTAENTAIRDLGRMMSDVRDDSVVRDAFETLVDEAAGTLGPDEVAAVREGLAPSDVGPGRDAALDRARPGLASLLARVETDWTVPDDVTGAEAVIDGLVRGYARGRDAFADALEHPTTDALHDWRKRVKDHGYHCRLLRPLWPPVMKVVVGRLGELADLLGDDHDLAVLRERLDANPDRFGGQAVVATTTARIDRRRARLQRAAVSLGHRVYVERPKALRRRVSGWWDAAVADAAVDTASWLVRPGT